LRKIAALKVSRKTTTGHINPITTTKKYLKEFKSTSKAAAKKDLVSSSKTDGIDNSEISRRKAAGECLRCAWPSDRKGNHRVKDCRPGIKLEKGTATFPQHRNYHEPTVSSEGSDPADSSGSEEI